MNTPPEDRPLDDVERALVARLEAFDEAARSGTAEPTSLTELAELAPAAGDRLRRARVSVLRLRQSRPPTPSAAQHPEARSIPTKPGERAAEREATALLYRRLRTAYTVLFVVHLYLVWACYSGVFSAHLGTLAGSAAVQAVVGVDHGFLLAASAVSLFVSSALLWAGVPLGGPGLRRLEAWNYLLLCLFFATWEYGLFTMPAGGFIGPEHHSTWLLYSLAVAQQLWISLLTTAGLLIPKSTRRCAWMMAAGVVASTASLLAAGYGEPAVARAVPALLPDLLVGTVGVGVICLVCTRKLRASERAAREAREMGEYRLVELLGSGGMGEVWRAEHRLLKRPCAVKLIRPERAGDPEVLRRFEREVQATARLRHPNTVAVFDYGTTEDGTLYYVMEYLPGLSLDRLVAQYGPLPPARVVHLLRQVCGALREAHEAGLVHRDLKPANLFVCDAGPADRAKLLDFGLVRSAGSMDLSADLTQDGRLVGTPGFMTPEQIEGRTVDARTDLYSLGAVAYFALTGREPFGADSAMRTLLAHLHDPPPPLRTLRPDVPASLEAVVLCCLSKHPADRPGSAAELDRALGQCEVGGWTEDDATAWWRRGVSQAAD
jgi:hypothetical protein